VNVQLLAEKSGAPMCRWPKALVRVSPLWLPGPLLLLTLGLWLLAWPTPSLAGAEPARPPQRATSQPSTSQTTEPRTGRALFRRHCARCHGEDGAGLSTRDRAESIPDFSSQRWQASRSDAQLLVSVREGKGKRMPAFRGKVSDQEARDLVAQVRAFDPKPPPKPADGPADDFDKRFRQLQEELADLKKQFRELSATPRKP
jgi:mono/diheme cytochrome c family protein